MSFLLLLLTSYHIIETIQIHYFTVTKVRSLKLGQESSIPPAVLGETLLPCLSSF